MRVLYHGPFDEVEIPDAGGRPVTVRRGEIVDLPDDVAARLLEQSSIWAVASRGRRTMKSESTEG